MGRSFRPVGVVDNGSGALQYRERICGPPALYKIPLLQKGVSERLIARYLCVERDLMRRVVLEELRAF